MTTLNKFNINTQSHWDDRFSSGDWGNPGGAQTRGFAESQIKFIDLPLDFKGTICDFGCGTGDALPVYKEKWPRAQLVGVDFSKSAIEICKRKYSNIADFINGEHNAIPDCDVIICSNTIEHIESDNEVIEALLGKCSKLYITVPYKEEPLSLDHLRSYNKSSFSNFKVISTHIFLSKGWSYFGVHLYLGIYIKNIIRKLFNKKILKQRYQIIYEIQGIVKNNNEQ